MHHYRFLLFCFFSALSSEKAVAQTGEDKWIFTTDGYKQNHLKYFKADDTYCDDIYSIITSNEAFLDAEVALGGILSTPVVLNRFILFSSTEGVVYCLKKKE